MEKKKAKDRLKLESAELKFGEGVWKQRGEMTMRRRIKDEEIKKGNT